jgi:protein involved in sex pheromone biosynthesis
MKTTVHIHYVKYSWETKGKFELFSYQLDDAEYRTYVCSQEVEIDVPADYDPRAQQIAALEKLKQEAMADFQKSVDDINERISKLQALEYTA